MRTEFPFASSLKPHIPIVVRFPVISIHGPWSVAPNCTTDLPLLPCIRLSMTLLMRARPQILERAGDEQSKKYIAELEAA